MNLEPWDPFQRLEEFRRRSIQTLNDLSADLPVSETRNEPIAFQPHADLVETPGEFRLYLSIPGLVEDDILIDVAGKRLTIRGERRPPYDTSHRKTSLQEWTYGFFERNFELTSLISISTIRAGYDAGVLTIVVEKTEEHSSEAKDASNDTSSPLDDEATP